MANNFDAQLFLKNYESSKKREGREIRPSSGFDAGSFLQNYRSQKGIPAQPQTTPAPVSSGVPFGQMVTEQGANPWFNIARRREGPEPTPPDAVETAMQEGQTVQERLARLNQAWQLGMAAAQQRMSGAVVATEEALNPLEQLRDQTREFFGMEGFGDVPLEGPQDLNRIATEAVREITKDYQPMQSGDVKGILSGVQYAGEMIAQSAPAMFGTLASGPMAPLFAATNMAGEAHDELLEAVPDMELEQRVAVSWGAGTAMASLELLGLGTVFRGLTPGTVSRMAIEGGLTDFLQQRGIKAAAARVLQAGIAEGSTELLQEGILMATGAAAGGEYGREQVTERLREAFFGGAAAGAGIRTGVEAISSPRKMEEIDDAGGITDEDFGFDEPPAGLPAPPRVLALPPPSPENQPPTRAVVTPPPEGGGGVIAVPPEGPGQITKAEIDERMEAAADTIVGRLYRETRRAEPVTEETVRGVMQLDDRGLEAAQAELEYLGRQLDPSESDYTDTLRQLQRSMRLLNLEKDLRTRETYDSPEHVRGDNIYDDNVQPWVREFLDQVKKDTGFDAVIQVGTNENRQGEWMPSLPPVGIEGALAQTRDDTTGQRFNRLVYNDKKGKLAQLETIAHEIGHALEVRMLNQDPDLRMRVMQEYINDFNPEVAAEKQFLNRTTTRFQKQHGPRFLKNAASNEKAASRFGPNSVSAIGRRAATDEVIDRITPANIYATGFREWFADQVARHLTTNQPGTTIVDKFFKRVAKLWQAIVRRLNDQGYAAPSVAEAYERLRAANGGVDPDNTPINDPTNALLNPLGRGVVGGGSRSGIEYADQTTLQVEEVLAQMGKVGKRLKIKTNTAKADYYNGLVRFGWNVIQLAKKNTHIQWLQEYVQHASRWHAEKTKWMSQADGTVKKWNALPHDVQDRLASFIFDVEQMKYRTPKEVKDGVVRKPTKAEFQALARAHKLTREAGQVYLQVRSDFDTFLKEIEQVAMAEIARAYPNNQIVRQLEQKKAQNEFDQLRKRPYFPHARFGLYTIIVKDKKGKTVYMESFDKIKDRNRSVSSIKKRFPADHKVSASQLSEEGAIFQGMPYTLLTLLKKNLNLTPKQQADLDQLLVQASPAVSFKNHFVRRKDTAGYSTDALRSYSDYFWHGANHIARIKHKPLLEQSIQDGKDDISQTYLEGDVDTTKRVQINDHLSRHLDTIMNPENDWAALRSVGFLWWLGFNVKSAVLNFTQVPMVTQSYLAANFGDARAAVSMTKAMKEFQGLFRSPEKVIAQHNPADGKLIGKGIEMGFLDESFAMELAGLAEGSNLLSRRAGSRARKIWIGFNQEAGRMFQGVEKLNRRITFMAAVDLARNNLTSEYLQTVKQQNNLIYADLIKEGFPHSEALAFIAGRDAVNSTQFEYSAWARPEVMQGKVKSTVLTFFMFTQNMLWFIQNSPGNTRYLAILLLFAGIKGMPGAEDLEELAKGIGARLHKDWDMERELREQLIEIMGPDGPNPDLFLNGISRYGFGLPLLSDMTGLPLPSFDMSPNISMGSPLPVVSPTLQAFAAGMQGRDFDDTFAEMTKESAGPTFGIPIGIAETIASDSYSWSDPKRWEPAMPAAVGGLLKAWRYYHDGEEKMRGGARLIEYEKEDPVHMAEMIAQAMGFNATRKAQAWDEVIMKREAGNFWMIRRGLLLTQMDRARSKSPEDVREVQAAINRYNKQVPHRDLAIGRDTILRSMKARDAARERREAGQPDAKMLRPIYREIEQLHPENRQDEVPSERFENAPSGR